MEDFPEKPMPTILPTCIRTHVRVPAGCTGVRYGGPCSRNGFLASACAQPAMLTLLATLLLRYRHIPIRAYTFAGMRTCHYAALADVLNETLVVRISAKRARARFSIAYRWLWRRQRSMLHRLHVYDAHWQHRPTLCACPTRPW